MVDVRQFINSYILGDYQKKVQQQIEKDTKNTQGIVSNYFDLLSFLYLYLIFKLINYN